MCYEEATTANFDNRVIFLDECDVLLKRPMKIEIGEAEVSS